MYDEDASLRDIAKYPSLEAIVNYGNRLFQAPDNELETESHRVPTLLVSV